MTREEAEFRPGRAPSDLGRVARIINRKVQEEVMKDPFGAEVIRRMIEMNILEIESKRQGAHEDLIEVDEDSIVKDFIESKKDRHGLYE